MQLRKLRATATTHAYDKALISISQLDDAVKALALSRQELQTCGHNISKRAFTSSSSSLGATRKRGRKTKVHDAKCIELVKMQLQKYLKESDRIVVIGRSADRIGCSQASHQKEVSNLHGRVGAAQSYVLDSVSPYSRNPFPPCQEPQATHRLLKSLQTSSTQIVASSLVCHEECSREAGSHLAEVFLLLRCFGCHSAQKNRIRISVLICPAFTRMSTELRWT